MVNDSSKILDSLRNKLKNLDKTRKKQEYLFQKKHLALRDIERVYSALFLSEWAHFEAFIEELFLGLMIGKVKHSKNSTICPRIEVKSPIIGRELIYAGRNYVNWLPYDNTIQRANVFFRGGRPFTLLNKDDIKTLETCIVIRNALAHQSRYSRLRFNQIVSDGLSLRPKERNPKSFLRSQFSATPSKNWYEYYTLEISRIAANLC